MHDDVCSAITVNDLLKMAPSGKSALCVGPAADAADVTFHDNACDPSTETAKGEERKYIFQLEMISSCISAVKTLGGF